MVYRKIATDLGSGSRYFKQFVELLPIIQLSNAEEISLLEDASEFNEEYIDKIVYSLYGLDDAEISLVEK